MAWEEEKEDREAWEWAQSQLFEPGRAVAALEMRKLGKRPDMLKEVDMLRKERSKMENRQAMKVDKPLAFVYLL